MTNHFKVQNVMNSLNKEKYAFQNRQNKSLVEPGDAPRLGFGTQKSISFVVSE
jgi:hypothetical protein